MQITAPTTTQYATQLISQFGGRDASSVQLDRGRDTKEFADPGAFEYVPRFDGMGSSLPPVTRLELGEMMPNERAITFRVDLYERGSLFRAVDERASVGVRDGRVTDGELTGFLHAFDSTPHDGVFELAQQQRLAQAFPERLVSTGTQRFGW